jgi:2,3-bisphosphoglycerate-independent phosphoglycerate mutase
MKKVLMVIRDGWGHREETENNAIAQANTPFTDMLMETYPHVLLDAAGPAVGLPM